MVFLVMGFLICWGGGGVCVGLVYYVVLTFAPPSPIPTSRANNR